MRLVIGSKSLTAAAFISAALRLASASSLDREVLSSVTSLRGCARPLQTPRPRRRRMTTQL
jgi:hypothetical protein